MTVATNEKKTAKDFASDQEVRWCPGCGDYAILKCMQRTLADLQVESHNTVFVSGIGCAARFPYYMSTYGFHTIHGRAPAFATGIKTANPELDVWIITGDGDALSIGGNHLIHVLRRNVDVQIILFNNEIYGLTKGQYSPTSRRGTRSPSTPKGSVESPISATHLALGAGARFESPISATHLALGAGARFVARSIDTSQKHLAQTLTRAHTHRGASFVEVFQNCVVFNDKAFAHFTDKPVAGNNQLHLEHGKPMLFGADNSRGVRLREGSNLALEAVTIGENGVTEADVLVHDEKSRIMATLIASLEPPEFPVAVGVLYCDPKPSFGDELTQQAEPTSKRSRADIQSLLESGRTWTVAG